MWAWLTNRLSAGVDHANIFRSVSDEGVSTGRYLMMTVLSAAIATLGLLLSSPAVVIGAMLLSPLMGPIILLGFSFWTLDGLAVRRALASLALGFAAALVVAVLLTWASPLKEPTAEILARTRPNLFDLLVAAFSGVAGGYAVIRQRGETVIGVAIATALMPPIATVGFGLGAGNWTVTLGALLLFATNLIAIALAAAGMAALYGFQQHYRGGGRRWLGPVAILLLVAGLCVPLTLSLNTIALESRATATARGAIRQLFGREARVTTLTVRSHDRSLEVGALVATPKFIPHASVALSRRLQSAFGRPTRVSLQQIVLADPNRLAAAVANTAPAPDPTSVAVQALHDAVPFPTAEIAFDPATHRGLVILGPESGLDLAAARSLEAGLAKRDAVGAVWVIPPLQPLPAAVVRLAGKDPPQIAPQLATAGWALQRWGVRRAQLSVCGLAARDKRRKAVIAGASAILQPLSVGAAANQGHACSGLGGGVHLVITPAPPEPVG